MDDNVYGDIVNAILDCAGLNSMNVAEMFLTAQSPKETAPVHQSQSNVVRESLPGSSDAHVRH